MAGGKGGFLLSEAGATILRVRPWSRLWSNYLLIRLRFLPCTEKTEPDDAILATR